YQTAKELLTDLRRLKQRLDFEAELERSVSPEAISSMKTISGAAALPTAQVTAANENAVSISSAEYIVSEIKRHKVGAGIVAMLFIVVLGTGLFFYLKR